ncbi:MAG: mechanosensitive ion channel, partial [Gammaproteobacteria bacterium]|nr:mechanosensitive ion channel [Gammaproteobacteria bacterium]
MTADADDPRLATGLVRFFQRVALIVVGIIGLIILLGHFSVDITGLVATLGVGSLAFALAAQAAFEDTISG